MYLLSALYLVISGHQLASYAPPASCGASVLGDLSLLFYPMWVFAEFYGATLITGPPDAASLASLAYCYPVLEHGGRYVH